MSASSKKKLRKEQEAAKMTEKQLAAQKEAKKVNLYTAAFVAVMAVILVVAIVVGVSQTITNTGIREKNTVAMTIGEEKLSNAQLNYFFMDAVNNFYSNYGSYASMFGLDVTLPLNEQFVDEESGLTWADDFLASAKDSAVSVYAMAAEAEAAGYTLPENTLTELENQLSSLDLYATMYGYADGEAYLKAIYGKGATKEGYLEYTKLNALANSYYNHYADSLTYDDAAIREAEAENFNAYSSFTFNSYYLSTSRFQEGGTTGEDGVTTYSDEEKAAAAEACKAAFEELLAQQITSVETLDAAIAAMPVNAETSASSTAYTDTKYANVNSSYAQWLTSEERKEGDVAIFPNETTSTDEDGNETTTLNGYYIIYYISSNDNAFALKDARHILVSFQGGTTDETTGQTTYSDEEKAAAKETAEQLLADWKAGEATEESFAALANEKSDDGDGTTGGLYENIYPGQMVTNFNDWCYDEARKAGDTGIVETEYGYHVMYFVGDGSLTYRDYQITEELRTEAVNTWYDEVINGAALTDGEIKYLSMDLVLSPAA
ncbi:MAG: peptidylprolyl isomerase [Oscillospiraceae bacterium]|nr:peptidylprolyl isomerase [Oscillospiraceae bacterium]